MVRKVSKDRFVTDNFALAAYLRAKQCNLLHVDKKDPRHALFIFEESSEREKLTKEFWEKRGRVEPRDFYSAQKDLKSLLYDASYI